MKLHEIQQRLKAPKSQYNSFSKFYYRNAEDILEAVKPLLNGSVLTISDTVVEVGGRVYVKATVRLVDGDVVWSVDGWAREAVDRKGMDDSQITGATSSYARKYALNGLFLIDDTKDADHDDGNATNAPVALKKAPPSSVKPDHVLEDKKRIVALLKDLGKNVTKDDAAITVYGLTQLQLEEKSYADIIDRLQVLVTEKQ